MTFLCVNYHAVQVVLFVLMCLYVFKIKKLHEKLPVGRGIDDEDDWN
jgi:hypothetical protein